MPKTMATLWELRRRKVFRGIGYYLVGAWTLLQVAEVIAEPAGLPAWTLTALLYLSVVGFPLAVWLAWRYELTEQGLVRTQPATEAQADYSLRASDYVIFTSLLLVIGAIAWQGLANIRDTAQRATVEAEAAAELEREAVENSVAVLPFSDLSLDGGQAFLGEGVADTVLHVLSQVEGLTVTARTSSFAFRNRDLTIGEIARELGVAHVLEGSVQRAGDQVRIIARLIDGTNGREIWSSNFDRELDAIFAIQDEIAREVVSALSVEVLEDDRERLADRHRPDLHAYEQYVRALGELDQGSSDRVASAVTRLRRAIEIDPDYSLAYTALARALRQQARVMGNYDFETVRAEQTRLVDRALELDPDLAEAWDLKGMLAADMKDFEAAAAANARALELDPNSPGAWQGRANLLLLKSDNEGALQAMRKAAELDPGSSQIQSALATQLFNAGRAEEAIFTLRENVRRHPNAPRGYATLARYLNQTGRPGEAMWYLQTALRRDADNHWLLHNVCLQHWQLWDNEAARSCFERAVAQAPGDQESRKWVAMIDGDWGEAVRISEVQVERNPKQWYPRMQLADALSQTGDWQRVAETVTAAFPGLMAPQPEVNDFTVWGARRLAQALQRTGQGAQARLLAEAGLQHIQRSRKLQAGGWMAGPDDAFFLSLLGDDAAAMETLAAAIEDDWMFYAQATFEDSIFDHLAEDASFRDLAAGLDARMAEQRAWYEEHRDDLRL